MTEIVTSLYDDHDQAKEAVSALESAGFSSSEISLVASSTMRRSYDDDAADGDVSGGAATGATIGGVAGAGAGLLAALGVIAIPGLGPLVAAGTLATTLTTAAGGALAGGIVGSLVDYGMSEDDANLYAEGVRRGGTLVTVRAPDRRAVEARAILDRYNPVNAGERRKQYMGSGWSRFDDPAPFSMEDDIDRERERRR